MKFTKMQGAGNDYIYVDGMKEDIQNESEIAKKLSDRHFSVGADGMIVIKKGTKADFEMVMYNADGSRGAMCGNGIRCVAKYVFDHNYTSKTEFTIESMGSVKYIKVRTENGKVKSAKVDMGKPNLCSEDIPVICKKSECINEEIILSGRKFNMTCVSMGNPHAVIFIDENPADFELDKYGKEAESKINIFPDRVNAEFAKIIDRNTVEMRVYERGAGETLACGTGACATVVAGIINGLLDNKVTVKLLGGELEIEWSANREDSVLMSGPCEYAFTGEVDI